MKSEKVTITVEGPVSSCVFNIERIGDSDECLLEYTKPSFMHEDTGGIYNSVVIDLVNVLWKRMKFKHDTTNMWKSYVDYRRQNED